MTRHLRPGTHWVRIPGQGRRKVKVLRSGQWRFLRGRKGGSRKQHRGCRSRRHWVPGHWSR